MTNSLSLIKTQVMDLYNKKSNVHIDISHRREKRKIENVPAIITAVYSNIFTATLTEDNIEKSYTFQYVDLLTNIIYIRELSELNS